MAQKKPTPTLPDPVLRDSKPYVIDDLGQWLILSDVHIPFHDNITIDLALKEAQRRKVKGILLNGDLCDCHELSRWDKSPDDPRYPEEVTKTKQFLDYLRWKIPKIPIVFKHGNHEERVFLYLFRHAPALFGLDVLTLPRLLEFDKYGIVDVADRRVIRMGHLNVIHGHEYRPAIQTPVNPARGVFLRAKASVLTSHFHQVSEHHEPTIAGKQQGSWSIGCACDLNPLYMPINRWSTGFAFVELSKGGNFSVDNLRVMDGEIV